MILNSFNAAETNVRLIQTSFPCTGSTLLANILQGLFCPHEPLCVCPFIQLENLHQIFANFVIKTHNTNISTFDNIHDYDLWFVTSSRDHRRINNHPKLINFEYTDILETPKNGIETIVNKVADTLKQYLPKNICEQIQIESGIERVKNMNEAYKTLEHLPFSHINPFYCIHGSHKHRWGSESDLSVQRLINCRLSTNPSFTG